MLEIATLLVFITVNGQPQGDTRRINAMDSQCRSEMAVVNGMNQVLVQQGIQYLASCERQIGTVRGAQGR